MNSQKINLLPKLASTFSEASKVAISPERKAVLKPLIEYIQAKVNKRETANLNFICTHNSRRSQLSQIWAQTAADYFGINAKCFSGGVEVTAFNERAVQSIKRSGFKVESTNSTNPVYSVYYAENQNPIRAFSKLYDDPENEAKSFAAVMTCDHADENCPFIPGTEKRIAVRYNDPKAFDDSPQESAKYDERSLQIASEMIYVFSKIEQTNE